MNNKLLVSYLIYAKTLRNVIEFHQIPHKIDDKPKRTNQPTVKIADFALKILPRQFKNSDETAKTLVGTIRS